MLIERLQPSSVLEVLKYSDFDQFRHVTRIVEARSIPLQATVFSAATAIIRLPGCQIYLQRTFPRILDAALQGNTLVAFSMLQGVPYKANGLDIDFPALALGRGGAGYKVTERQTGIFALIAFDNPVVDRGWPEVEHDMRVFRLAPPVLVGLQEMIQRDIRVRVPLPGGGDRSADAGGHQGTHARGPG